MWIIIVGTPVDGYKYHGPFESEVDAVEWADYRCGLDWWQAELSQPKAEA